MDFSWCFIRDSSRIIKVISPRIFFPGNSKGLLSRFIKKKTPIFFYSVVAGCFQNYFCVFDYSWVSFRVFSQDFFKDISENLIRDSFMNFPNLVPAFFQEFYLVILRGLHLDSYSFFSTIPPFPWDFSQVFRTFFQDSFRKSFRDDFSRSVIGISSKISLGISLGVPPGLSQGRFLRFF